MHNSTFIFDFFSHIISLLYIYVFSYQHIYLIYLIEMMIVMVVMIVVMEMGWFWKVRNQKCKNNFFCYHTSNFWFVVWFFCCHCCYCYCCCYYHSCIYWYIVNHPLFYFCFTHICIHTCIGVCVFVCYVHVYMYTSTHIYTYILLFLFSILFHFIFFYI